MKKFKFEIHSEENIKNHLLTLPKSEQKIKYLRKIIQDMKDILRNNYYGGPNRLKYIARPDKLSRLDLKTYFIFFRIYKTTVDSLMEIDRIKRKSKLYQITWIGKPDQLEKFVDQVIDKSYLNLDMKSNFKNLFYIKNPLSKKAKIQNDVNWNKSQKSLIYLLVTLNKKNNFGKKLIVFKNNWSWIENIFRQKSSYFYECKVQSEKFNKLRNKKSLNKILQNIYNA